MFLKSLLVHGDGARGIQHPRQRGASSPLDSNRCTDLPRKFYCEEHCSIGESYARFAFCKDVDTLRAAVERLKNLTKYLKKRD